MESPVEPKLRTKAPSGLTYSHAADFSGGVSVWVPMGRHVGTSHGVSSIDLNDQQAHVLIPFEDMRHLVLASLRGRMLLHLEEADDDTLEKFFFSSVTDAPAVGDAVISWGSLRHIDRLSEDGMRLTDGVWIRAAQLSPVDRRVWRLSPAWEVAVEEPEMCGKNATPGFANPPCPLDADHDGDCTTI